MGITLHGWGRLFGCPSPSPFVMKADIQMQMLGLEFQRATADLESVDKHKAPYVWDDGTLVQDSTFIRQHFEAKLGLNLDEGLGAEQRGAARALECMREAHLCPIMASERWLIPDNFERGPKIFFMRVPEAAREGVIKSVLADVAKSAYGSGVMRFTRSERMTLAALDIAAVASMLGNKSFVFGARPTAVDAIAFGALEAGATRFFESELPDLVTAHPTLVTYLERMRERYFATDRWPAMGGPSI